MNRSCKIIRLGGYSVGEHSNLRRRCVVMHAGAVRKENVGISNDK
jgi:hypothetical protein